MNTGLSSIHLKPDNNDRTHDAVSQKVYKILRGIYCVSIEFEGADIQPDYSTNKSDMPDSSERKILMEEILKVHRCKFWTDKRLVKYFHNRRQTVRRRATCSLMRPEMDSYASEGTLCIVWCTCLWGSPGI